MIRSLAIKLGMLAVTIGLVCWIGWQPPEGSLRPTASGDGAPAVAVSLPAVAESHGRPSERVTASRVTAQAGAIPHTQGEPAISGLLDLNRAGTKDLESLSGIGPVLAQRVIEYRTTVGRFQAIDDLRRVKGIGPKIFERITPLVTVTLEDGKAEKQL